MKKGSIAFLLLFVINGCVVKASLWRRSTPQPIVSSYKGPCVSKYLSYQGVYADKEAYSTLLKGSRFYSGYYNNSIRVVLISFLEFLSNMERQICDYRSCPIYDYLGTVRFYPPANLQSLIQDERSNRNSWKYRNSQLVIRAKNFMIEEFLYYLCYFRSIFTSSGTRFYTQDVKSGRAMSAERRIFFEALKKLDIRYKELLSKISSSKLREGLPFSIAPYIYWVK